MTDQTTSKRSSKSQRTYVRRLKQAARKAGLPYYRPVELLSAKPKGNQREGSEVSNQPQHPEGAEDEQ